MTSFPLKRGEGVSFFVCKINIEKVLTNLCKYFILILNKHTECIYDGKKKDHEAL